MLTTRSLRTALPFALLVPAVLGLTPDAGAMHRQSPPAARLSTSTADNSFPRLPPSGPALTWAEGPTGNRNIYQVKLSALTTPVLVSNTPGDNSNPSATRVGRYVVWENDPGSMIPELWADDRRSEVALNAFSAGNPASTGLGNRVFFESTVDIDFFNTNPTNARQIFQRFKDGTYKQISRGEGTSRNAAATKGNGIVAFESTSDPTDGHDTGVFQVWVGDATPIPATATAVTNGAAPSELPQISSDGTIVAFQTRSALATTGLDTGVNQVFVYTTHTQTYAQITDDPAGCEGPSAYRLGTNYRIAFTCGGLPFFYDLQSDQLYRVPMPPGSHTAQTVSGLGFWFLHVSTTGDLLTNGLTPNHHLYVINLYKRPYLPVPGTATWFPFRGI